jgi:hypothetical protein
MASHKRWTFFQQNVGGDFQFCQCRLFGHHWISMSLEIKMAATEAAIGSVLCG